MGVGDRGKWREEKMRASPICTVLGLFAGEGNKQFKAERDISKHAVHSSCKIRDRKQAQRGERASPRSPSK